jgi:hypothetical protein
MYVHMCVGMRAHKGLYTLVHEVSTHAAKCTPTHLESNLLYARPVSQRHARQHVQLCSLHINLEEIDAAEGCM